MVQRFQNENFAILGINTDNDADTFRAKCDEYEISWDNIFNGSTSGGVPQAWGVSGYPTTFLLDAEGRIRFKGLRHDAVAPEVEALLAE